MTIDEEIEQELETQAFQRNNLHYDEQGLLPLLKSGFCGGLKRWMILAYIMALLLALTIVYCAYQFFTADVASQNFWGICLVLAFQAQVGTKIWIWLEMQRSSTLRELKRIELAVALLAEKRL